jgi:transcriptional regulator with XRE-family HTH domain
MIADILADDPAYSAEMTPLADEDLAAYVRRVRMEKGLSTKLVEERSGGEISRGYISQIEGRHSINPTGKKLLALATGLGISSTHLFELVRTKRGHGADNFRHSSLYVLYERTKRTDPETRKFINQQIEVLLSWLDAKEQGEVSRSARS